MRGIRFFMLKGVFGIIAHQEVTKNPGWLRKRSIFQPEAGHFPDREIILDQDRDTIVKEVGTKDGVTCQNDTHTIAQEFPTQGVVTFRDNVWRKARLFKQDIAETAESGSFWLADEFFVFCFDQADAFSGGQRMVGGHI